MDNNNNWFDNIFKRFDAFNQRVTSLTERGLKWVEENKEPLDNFFRVIKYYEEELADIDATKKQAVEILRRYGWFLTPSTIPLLMAFPVVNIGKRDGDQSEEIDRLFIEVFTNDNFRSLESMVQDWQEIPIFRERVNILRDCLITLQNGCEGYNPSNVIIPTLLAQIDGIITDFMEQSNLTPINKYKTTWENEQGKPYAKGKGREDFINENTEPKMVLLSDELKGLVIETIFKDIFGNTFLYEDARSELNRNKVQHGEFNNYGTLANSIRIFLILDFLAYVCIKLEE